MANEDLPTDVRGMLRRVLEWPLPHGTVETFALPEWLAEAARRALAESDELVSPNRILAELEIAYAHASGIRKRGLHEAITIVERIKTQALNGHSAPATETLEPAPDLCKHGVYTWMCRKGCNPREEQT